METKITINYKDRVAIFNALELAEEREQRLKFSKTATFGDKQAAHALAMGLKAVCKKISVAISGGEADE